MAEQQLIQKHSYQSFLLRIWQPHPAARWCYQLKSVSGSQSMTFESPEELVVFMQALTPAATQAHLGS